MDGNGVAGIIFNSSEILCPTGLLRLTVQTGLRLLHVAKQIDCNLKGEKSHMTFRMHIMKWVIPIPPFPKSQFLGQKRKNWWFFAGDLRLGKLAAAGWRTARDLAAGGRGGYMGGFRKKTVSFGGTPNHRGKSQSENHRKTIGKSQSEKRCQWMVSGCSVEFRIPKYGWL